MAGTALRHRILDQSPADGLSLYLALCDAAGADVELVKDVAESTVAYLNADKAKRATMRANQELERRWYDALARGRPDWGIYGDDRYLGDLWACWIVYSRQYLRNVVAPSSLPPDGVAASLGRVRRIADLGCGIGFTTAALTEMFPGAEAWGTNLEGIRQTMVAKQMGRLHGFQVVATIEQVPHVDLVFASEYFEHMPRPLDHLDDVLRLLQPRALLVANTFTSRSPGHFDRYRVNGDMLPGKTTSKLFNNLLRVSGYTKVETKLWNSRPALWMKGH